MKKALLITLSLGALVCAGLTQSKDCCAGDAKAAKTSSSCTTKVAKAGCGKMPRAEDQFMAEAKKMEANAQKLETGKEACCKSTAEKPMAKGDDGCCNAKSEPAKFKVYIAGVGYKYFGCEDSAGKARKQLLAKHTKVGPVQKVNTKISIG